jgi:hypothetical protein
MTKSKTSKTPKKNSSQVTPRWVSLPRADGRVFVLYEHQRCGQYNVRTVPGAGRVTFERAGHWDYDHCEIVGARDHVLVEVGQ